MEANKIAIIGCGNLGTAILKGLLSSNHYKAEDIIVTKRNLAPLEKFKSQGVKITSDNAEAIENSSVVLIALKPHNIISELSKLKHVFDPKKQILVSLATGISMQQISDAIESDTPVFRAMPNTAADVGESLTCICSNSQVSEQNRIVASLFSEIGKTQQIDEKLMEAATVLGACGIAYVLRFIRAMVQGGIQIGFDSETASNIVNQTVNGASKILLQNQTHPEEEIDKVTTPRGCTIEGLNEMEHNGFSSALIKGIVTSFEKIEKT